MHRKSIAMILGLGMGILTTVPAAAEEGDWLVRLRATYIAPDVSSETSIGGRVDISDELIPELDITYFFTDTLAAELVLATAKHNVDVLGSALGDVELGDVWLLPPTLLLQYHPLAGEAVSPYVGAGVNYTFFYNQDPPVSGPVTDVNHKNSLGFALQAGADFKLSDDWVFNVDLKRIFLDTDVSINGGAITADVDLDPWFFGVGFGRRF